MLPIVARSEPRRTRNQLDKVAIVAALTLGPPLAFAPLLEAQDGVRIDFNRIQFGGTINASAVTAIAQDSSGLMWFGTSRGLLRYDGRRFERVPHDPDDPSSPAADFVNINAMLVDRYGHLWVGTRRGASRLDPATGLFTNYGTEPGGLRDPVVSSFLDASDGRLWIGTNTTLFAFDRESGRFTPLSVGGERALFRGVTALTEDAAGTIWIGSRSGLFAYDANGDSLHVLRADSTDPGALARDDVFTLTTDSRGQVWGGTLGGGAFVVDPSDRTVANYRHDPANPYSLPENDVLDIAEDSSGVIWMATWGTGVGLLSPATGGFDRAVSEVGDRGTIAGNQVYSILHAPGGVTWIGARAGLTRATHPLAFTTYEYRRGDAATLAHPMVGSVFRDRAGTTWVGTVGGGITRIPRSGHAYRTFAHDPTDPTSLSRDDVSAVLVDSRGTLWAGTQGAGLARRDRDAQRFVRYMHRPGSDDAPSSDFIHTIYEDRGGEIWIGTVDGGLNRYRRDSDTFETFPSSDRLDDARALMNVHAILETRAGDLWLSLRDGGIARFDRETGSARRYSHNPDDPYSLSSDFTTTITEDPDGALWVGTFDAGLDRFVPGTGVTARYDDSNGLPDRTVSCVFADERGDVWVATFRGLARRDRDSGDWVVFGTADGLPAPDFYPNSCFQADDGALLMGTSNGLLEFHPDSIYPALTPSPVVLTGIEISGRPAAGWLAAPGLQRLELPHDRNFVLFRFGVLDYRSPEMSRIRYRLEGIDPGWIDASETGFATYPDLAPGNYTLRVIGAGGNGVMNEEGATLQLVVGHPYWQTLWFRAVMLAAIGLALAVAHRRRTRSIRARAAVLQAEIDERKRLEAERERLASELQQSQKLEVVGQLTGGIAHDFNNLLTVVLGNLELADEMVDSSDARSVIKAANVAAQRGAALTQRLLAFSRKQPLRPIPVDVLQLVSGMDGLLRRTLGETLTIEISSGPHLWFCMADPTQLENVLLNLSINARDAMPQGGTLTIAAVNTVVDADFAAGYAEVSPGEYVVLSVGDTGVGMTRDVIDRAFEPFFTTKGVGRGSGLGLSMVYGFARQTGGLATISSQVGVGTTVSVYLPRAVNEVEATDRTSDPGVVAPGDGEQVLLVEDDDGVRRVAVSMLRKLGYRTLEARDAREAYLRAEQTDSLSLLLTDVVLPGGVNGFELTREIHRSRPDLPVLYMSGYTEDQVPHDEFLAPGLNLLPKPFDIAELSRSVRWVLEARD